MDIYSKEKRSKIMSNIPSSNTKPELIVRKFLFLKGLRYRINDKRLPGKPDIVLKKHRTVIFIHGCFWHNHLYCKSAKLPKTNKRFWTDKILKNVERDKRNAMQLAENGWKVITIWQCEIASNDKRDIRLIHLVDEILSGDST